MGDLVGGVAQGVMSRNAGRRASQGIQSATAAGASELIPTQTTGRAATDQMAALLGLGGDPAAAQNALRTFMDSTGFQNQLQQGTQAITGSAALGGILNSGATAKALQDRGQQMAQQTLMNYLAMLDPLSGRGAQASSQIGSMRQGGGQNAAGVRAQGDLGAAQGFGNALTSFGVPQAVSDWFKKPAAPAGIPASADWSTGIPR